MHWSAKPSDDERDSVYSWIDRGLASLAEAGIFPKDKNASSGEADAVYVCPMHPEITGGKDDNCTICNMALELKETSGDTGDAEDHSGDDH